MCVPLNQTPPSFFLLSIVWMCDCSPSNQTLPSFFSKFLFHQWFAQMCVHSPIRPFLFSLFGWLFVCDLRKCVCIPPNQTRPFFSLWFLIYLFDYMYSIHMNVCAPPIKPLLSSLSLSQLLTIHSSLCVFPFIKSLLFFLYNFFFFSLIIHTKCVCSPYQTFHFLSLIIHTWMCVHSPYQNPPSSYNFFYLVEYPCECVCVPIVDYMCKCVPLVNYFCACSPY